MLLSFYDPIYYSAQTVSKSSPNILMTNIFRNYKKYFDRVAKNYNLMTYYIQGAPRPETLSNTLYGNTQLYWVLLFANDVYDPFHGWIKTQEACYESISQFKEDAETTVAYHVDLNNEKYYNLVEYPLGSSKWYDKGDIYFRHVQYTGPLAAVSEYESAILDNEKLRKIKIIRPSDINTFIADFIKEMERNSNADAI